MTVAPLLLDFDDLFEQRGTLAMRFRPTLDRLNGRRVRLSGRLIHDHHYHDGSLMLTDDSGLCPDCSPVPVPSVFLPALTGSDKVTDAAATVTVEGRLSVGFVIDAQQRATLLRLLDARVLTTAKV